MYPDNVQIRQNQQQTLNGVSLIDPIPALIADPKEVLQYYKEFDIIPPYEGCTGIIELFHSLNKQSKTQGSITNSIVDVCFDSEVEIRTSKNGFNSKPASDTESAAYFDLLDKAGVGASDLRKVSKELYKAWKPTGNALLLLKFVEVAGVRSVSTEVVDLRFFRYLRNQKQFIVSERWFDFFYWKKNPPTIYDKFTSFEDINFVDGEATVAFHMKNTGYDKFLYAYPDNIHGLYTLFAEVQQQQGIVKEGHNHNIGRLLLLFDAMSSASGAKGGKNPWAEFIGAFTNAINDSVNMGGKYPSGIAAMAVPNIENMKEVKLEANNNHKFHDWLRKANIDDLFTINRWSQLLTGAKQPQGGIGADIMKNELFVWSVLKINGVQMGMSDFLHEPMNAISDYFNINIENKDLYFKNPYETIKDEGINTEVVGG